MTKLELISNHLCPYTQRAVIQLAEKGLPCERVYIDLANKPEWFLQMSPLGKVPVLRMQDATVFETAVIAIRADLRRRDPRSVRRAPGRSPPGCWAADIPRPRPVP